MLKINEQDLHKNGHKSNDLYTFSVKEKKSHPSKYLKKLFSSNHMKID